MIKVYGLVMLVEFYYKTKGRTHSFLKMLQQPLIYTMGNNWFVVLGTLLGQGPCTLLSL